MLDKDVLNYIIHKIIFFSPFVHGEETGYKLKAQNNTGQYGQTPFLKQQLQTVAEIRTACKLLIQGKM